MEMIKPLITLDEVMKNNLHLFCFAPEFYAEFDDGFDNSSGWFIVAV